MLKREMYLSPKANCAQLGTDFIVKKIHISQNSPSCLEYNHEELESQIKSSVTFLYRLKTSENQRFSDVFRRYKNVTLD